MTPHTLNLLGQVRATLAHTTGFEHAALLAALYAGLMFITWQAWLLLDRPTWRSTIGRLWHGKWVFQEQDGEWHRVVGRHRKHGNIIDARPRDKRIVEEVVHKGSRRKHILFVLLGLSCCAGILAEYYYKSGADIAAQTGYGGGFYFLSIGLLFVAVVGGFMGCIDLTIALVKELLYVSGNPRMTGAKVFDPEPVPRPGPELITGQKGHGDAKGAGAATIGEIFSGNRSGEPNIRFRT